MRPLVAGDRDAVARILEGTVAFTRVEIATALELIDAWLASGERSDYYTFVVEEPGDDQSGSGGGAVRGYVCFGPVPLTIGTFDLYWIAVDPATQGRGFGQRLLAFAEDDIRRRGGRLLLIETSSQETYGATRRFYDRSGYEIVACIRDFYRPGDDKLVFGKRLTA